MKESILAIYNTLQKVEVKMTPDNAKYMAGIYLKLEELFAKVAEAEKEKENEEHQTN